LVCAAQNADCCEGAARKKLIAPPFCGGATADLSKPLQAAFDAFALDSLAQRHRVELWCWPSSHEEAVDLVVARRRHRGRGCRSHSAIEEFAQELAYVTRRFLKTKAWEKTERIVVGGGFRDSRLGELAIARTEIIFKTRTSRSTCCRSATNPMTRA
jgi:hypothetical protein